MRLSRLTGSFTQGNSIRRREEHDGEIGGKEGQPDKTVKREGEIFDKSYKDLYVMSSHEY